MDEQTASLVLDDPPIYAEVSPGSDRAKHATAALALGTMVVVMGSIIIYSEVRSRRRN